MRILLAIVLVALVATYATAEDRFREAFQREEGRMKVVDQKFEELMKRKDELEDPLREIDLD